MALYGIIGYPLAHSFSKKYFTEKFLLEGITGCRYETFPLKSIDEFRGLLDMHPDLKGLSVTIPYKQQVLSLLDDTTNLPEGVNACNCIRVTPGRTTGFNTDITGFERSLISRLKLHHNRALVLGSGGAAEAVKYVLKKLGISFLSVSRKKLQNGSLEYRDLNESIMKEYTVIINTTPLGTFPAVNECADIPYRYLTPDHLLFDLIYNPEKTLFLQQGEARGASIENGYNMLVLQAEESWKIWNEN